MHLLRPEWQVGGRGAVTLLCARSMQRLVPAIDHAEGLHSWVFLKTERS
jgi:hypothetical protein